MVMRSPDAVIGEMKHYNIKTVAGCLSRVTCEISAPEGVDKTLTACLVYEGESRPATLESADVIIFPAVPYGHYAYEIRCGGKPVAFGHLLVRPSAFPHTDGVVDYRLEVDLSTAEAASVALTLTPGPRGPRGESGHVQSVIAGLPVVLAAGGVHDLGELGADVDLSELHFEERTETVQTAELWFSMGATAYAVTWPEGVVWATEEPTFAANTAYRFALRREPSGKFIINLAYEYSL